MEKLSLKPVVKDNWVECSRLKVGKNQEGNLASCLETIAQSAFEPHFELRAIQIGAKVVGMLAYCPEIDEPMPGLFWIFRIVVGKEYQGKGFGREAMQLSLVEIWKRGGLSVRTMCKQNNFPAIKCYESLGFRTKGMLDDGDILFELKRGSTASEVRDL